MALNIDGIVVYNGLPCRVFDFKAVNFRPGASIFYERQYSMDSYIPDEPFDVELSEIQSELHSDLLLDTTAFKRS